MDFPKLHFPDFDFRFQQPSIPGQSLKIFDIIRRKYVVLTQEEWVRQHLLHFLVNERKFPQSLLSVEKKVLVNNLFRRTDVVAYSSSLKPVLIAECKAPSIVISQSVFDQAARYNMTLDVNYFLITNGIDTHCCSLNHEEKSYRFFEEIPDYDTIKSL